MRYNKVISILQNLTDTRIRQSEIAEILGVTKQAITNRINRGMEFSPADIDRISKHYNVDLVNGYNNPGTTEIPILGNVSASMGYGLTVYDETKTGTYAVNNKLAKDLGINLSECDIIFAKGDSMEPTIIGGDSLLIDKSKQEVHDGRIYCVKFEGELYIKRLQKLPPKKLKVISDNQEKYDAWYVDFNSETETDFSIIGEVMWWGRVAR